MILTDLQLEFLENEFGISAECVTKFPIEELRTLREKCFGIETEEAYNADNNGEDISKRGETAAELVNMLLSEIKSKKEVLDRTKSKWQAKRQHLVYGYSINIDKEK